MAQKHLYRQYEVISDMLLLQLHFFAKDPGADENAMFRHNCAVQQDHRSIGVAGVVPLD